MLVIRYQRVGKKHQPDYRVVVVERRSKVGGPPLEYLGHYNPFSKKGEVKKDRYEYWAGIGAKPTPTVHNLLVRLGVISGKKIAVKMNKPEKVEGAPEAASATAPKENPAPQAEVVVENAPKPEEQGEAK